MADYDLDRLLAQVRRIEEHRVKGAEKEIRETYQKLLKDLRYYLADEYSHYAENDQLTYEILQRHGGYARFLEEVEQKINDITPETRRLIRSTVEQTYEATYNGMIDCVQKAATDLTVVAGLHGCTPDIIKRAVENPVSKLTLNSRLEKQRKEIIYNIKQNISVGLMNGDRYSTMAKRVQKLVEGDYKKAIRIVRTEAHRVREAGNHDAAQSVEEVLKTGESGMQMSKTWKTMRDERVRPAHRYKTKKGWRSGKPGKYDHKSMEGITIPVDEDFTLPSGATASAPGQSGVAGEDINCRCYLSYGLQKVERVNLSDRHELKLPDEIMEVTGMTEDRRIEIEKAITALQKKYDVRIGQISVESCGARERKSIMISGPYIDDTGKLKMALVINKDIDYNILDKTLRRQYLDGYFASRSVKDVVNHEMAHIMTFQGCKTVDDYKKLREKVKGLYVKGVSGYSDATKDGAETLSETFVRMMNGEKVPLSARLSVMKYVMRWKK